MNAAKEWANEIVNGRVDGNREELLAVAASIDELVAELADANAEIERITEHLRTEQRHVREALELLGVDVSVDGYIPDSWTLREQCKIAGQQLANANAELAKYAMTDPFKAYPSTVEDLIHLLGAYFVDVLPMAKVELLEDEIEAWEKLARPMLAKVLDTRDAEIERLRKENERLEWAEIRRNAPSNATLEKLHEISKLAAQPGKGE